MEKNNFMPNIKKRKFKLLLNSSSEPLRSKINWEIYIKRSKSFVSIEEIFSDNEILGKKFLHKKCSGIKKFNAFPKLKSLSKLNSNESIVSNFNKINIENNNNCYNSKRIVLFY